MMHWNTSTGWQRSGRCLHETVATLNRSSNKLSNAPVPISESLKSKEWDRRCVIGRCQAVRKRGNCSKNNSVEWIDQDVRLQDIAVLSARDGDSSSMEHLSSDLRKLLVELTEENVGSPPINKIITSRISDFKGLERAFVALIDLDCLEDSSASLAALYVGMTRAHAGLWLPVSSRFAPLLEKWQESVLPTLLEGRHRNE